MSYGATKAHPGREEQIETRGPNKVKQLEDLEDRQVLVKEEAK